jgi:MFS family permease
MVGLSRSRAAAFQRLAAEWRPSAITKGAPAFPLAVLFGLNAVDELDRAAFSVLLPDIRDHFGMTDAAALGLVGATAIAIVLIELPLALLADRRNRVRIAATGAAVWAMFSAATGLAFSVATLAVARVGAGGGKAVVTPTHSSLLSDYYEPSARVKVFSVHRLASSVGQVTGPLVAGVLAALFGWRAPFLLFAVPTIVLVLFALRLREPIRGERARTSDAAVESAALGQHRVGPWTTIRVLGSVPTIRRIWVAAPFLGVALFGVPSLLSLIYEDVFALGSAERGAIAAGIEPLQIIGGLLAMPAVARVSEQRPGFLLRFVAVIGVIDGVLLVALAYAPHVAIAVAAHALLAASIGTLAPAFFALVSLVAPPHVRSTAFTTMSLFAIPGVLVVLPIIGAASDAFGIQASVLGIVPVAIAAGLILSSAANSVADDIAVRTVTHSPLVVAGSAY